MRVPIFLALPFLCVSANAYEFHFETIVTGVDHPTALVFVDKRTALLAERKGALRWIRNHSLDPTPIAGVPDVYVAGQAGLLDVVLDPNFEQNQTLYLAYAQGTAKSNTLKVSRGRMAGHEIQNLQTIFAAQPSRTTAFHYGGRMVFLPDGTLLITCGDGFDYREQAQFLDNHFGKVLRLNTDGSVPADNPYVDSDATRPEIYSYGHRNPQGLVLGLAGEIYLHEHGPRGGDELNLIKATKNYGWPAITYGVDYSGAHVSPYSSYPGLEQPLLHWTPSIAPSGMTIYDGNEFPQWKGNLLVAALAERSIRRVVVKDDEPVDQEILFTELKQRIRDVRQGPNGEIYLLTDADDAQVVRVTKK